jgi:hypothetical protein
MARLAILLKDRLDVFVEGDGGGIRGQRAAGEDPENGDRPSKNVRSHPNLQAMDPWRVSQ